MRIWVDLTNSPHVLVLRPVIRALEAQGHRVEVTARDFAQTLGLADRLGIAHEAIGHRSNDVTVAAKLLGVPSATTFDYEWATAQHTVNCRLAKRVVVPDAIPPERLARYGAGARKLRQYAGLKEEYYLADFTPDDAVLT